MITIKQLRRGSRLVKGRKRAMQKRLRKARKLGKNLNQDLSWSD